MFGADGADTTFSINYSYFHTGLECPACGEHIQGKLVTRHYTDGYCDETEHYICSCGVQSYDLEPTD